MSANAHDLMGAYVAGALDAGERHAFEAHLAACDACADEVASLTEVVAHVADAAAVAPPASLRTGVLADIAAVAQEPRAVARSPRRVWPRMLVAAASALIIAGLGVVGVGAYRSQQETRALEHDVMMVTTAPDAHSMDLGLGTSHLVMSESMGAVVAMGNNAPMPAQGMEYQVFLLMDDGTSMPGPTFMPSSAGAFMTLMSAPMTGVVGVAVTEEPRGGSAQMTGPMVARVRL